MMNNLLQGYTAPPPVAGYFYLSYVILWLDNFRNFLEGKIVL